MARVKRPSQATRSEHWIRVAVNDRQRLLNDQVRSIFGWPMEEHIEWLSPLKQDDYAEYSDNAFLKQLGLLRLADPLKVFWPAGGPRWDGLARIDSGKVLLVEAKAYIEEAVDFKSKAKEPSLTIINNSLEDAKVAFHASAIANWESPFYQYANRLAHLWFLKKQGIDAYLLFLYFANATDVRRPTSSEEWAGAVRTTEKCLGLGRHPFRKQVKFLIMDVPTLLAGD